MTATRLDVLCIGNAIVDIIADCDDAFLAREGLTKGMMRLSAAEQATRLYAHMGPAREVSGGSAGNTAAGVAALGGATWPMKPALPPKAATPAAVLPAEPPLTSRAGPI